MKKKTFRNHLLLGKETIAHLSLNEGQMAAIKGGATDECDQCTTETFDSFDMCFSDQFSCNTRHSVATCVPEN